MKHLQTYENWRQVKAYLRIPQLLFELLLKKLINFVPRLSFLYDELAAKIDLGRGISYNEIKDVPQKLTLNDIENKALRNSLKVTGLFDNWNVYFVRKSEDMSYSPRLEKDVLYITKDELKLGDKYYGERLSIKSSVQMYIVAAIETEEQPKMRKERDDRYNNKKSKALEAAVNKAIKAQNIGRFNGEPILFKVVREDRIDLFNKFINSISKEKVKKFVSMKIDDEGYATNWGGKSLLNVVKSEEMKKLIRSIIYTPEELEKIELEEDSKKYNL